MDVMTATKEVIVHKVLILSFLHVHARKLEYTVALVLTGHLQDNEKLNWPLRTGGLLFQVSNQCKKNPPTSSMSVTALLHRYNNNNRNERLGLLNKQFMLVLNGRTNIQFINQKIKIKTFSAKYSIHRQLCSKFKCGKQIEVAFYGTELC